jgi:hypothetical protein
MEQDSFTMQSTIKIQNYERGKKLAYLDKIILAAVALISTFTTNAGRP